jgi:hypothetical protein
MQIALLTGPSGSGKTFVIEALPNDFERLSYDQLMGDSLKHAFPQYIGEQWDKRIWHDNKYRLDLREAFKPAFKWSGERPLIVEGYQLRESVWRKAVLDLARARTKSSMNVKLFVIRPALELLMRQRAESKYDHHKKAASIANCIDEIAQHEKMYVEQPWDGEVIYSWTKQAAVEAVRTFLGAK